MVVAAVLLAAWAAATLFCRDWETVSGLACCQVGDQAVVVAACESPMDTRSMLRVGVPGLAEEAGVLAKMWWSSAEEEEVVVVIFQLWLVEEEGEGEENS